MARKEETEEEIADQIMWLRRTNWQRKYPWQARQVSVSGHPQTRDQFFMRARARPDRSTLQEASGVLGTGDEMSGEDQRHSFHEDEINELVDSRVMLPDGRIVEQPPAPLDGGGGGAPATNPPNVIRGNNADL